jgi:2-polyprenyl-3-methyl-5-hydroxy-6-metoxy-1,4-benzoquinol methylase
MIPPAAGSRPSVATEIPQVHYASPAPSWPNTYIWPVLVDILRQFDSIEKRAFEIGCGNGATANLLSAMGFDVTAIDPSVAGLEIAKSHFPAVKFHKGDGYEPLAGRFGTYPLVLSLEVIEHCFAPRDFLRRMFELLQDDGVGIISTPFHGYWKNLAMALVNKWDAHLDPLWDGGHIKFFSERSLTALLREAGFSQIRFRRAGRLYPLAKSTIAIFRR